MSETKSINSDKLTGQEKIYKMITESILEKLEAGVIPWAKSWKTYGTLGGGMPINLVSNKAYRGINVILLNMQGYDSPYWLTFKQAKQLKGSVRKGERSTTIIFWKFTRKHFSEENGETGETETVSKMIPLLRYYRVFNSEQCEGLSHKRLEELRKQAEETEAEAEEFDTLEAAENIWQNYEDKPELKHGEARAFYQPTSDFINMPLKNNEVWEASEAYYHVLFHEATHSTGHKRRLNREGIINFTGFGSGIYGKEELVAEFGSAFLCGMAGIDFEKFIDSSASYIDNWKAAITADIKLVIQAAAQAQKATDYILNIKPETTETE
jgi:antirestriction protein ArdC